VILVGFDRRSRVKEVGMRNRWWLSLLAIGLIAALVSCSSDKGTSPPTSQPAAAPAGTTVAPSEPAAPPAEPPLEEPAVPASAVGPETAAADPASAFHGAQVALDSLESYRYTTSFLFAGEEDGKPESGSIELSGEIAGPDRKRLVWQDLDEDASFEVIQVGDEAWIFEDGEWQEVPILVAEAMSQAALVYAPSVTWSGLFGELQPDATYVGSEVVNGVLADHFTATYRQWGSYWQGELIDAAGDVWIAEAGFPVKYHFSATGIDENGDRGTVTWTMDLTDVNAPITIEPPF
jgi:hypothetical protein